MLDAYFDRIGYGGPATPTLDVLDALIARHTATIPFENLDVLLGRPIDLSPAALVQKLITDRRGGYCFEQNGLLLEVLTSMGFAVRPLSARVRYQRARDDIPPRTHVFLRVDLDATAWMADVGFGGFSPTCALRLDTDAWQPTPHETRRLVREGARTFHQVQLGDDWHDLSEFTGEAMPLVDRELANWYTSTHPRSAFRLRLTAAIAAPGGRRVTLLNHELTRRGPDGRADATRVASHEALLAILAGEFGLTLPPGTRLACEGLDWSAEPPPP